MNESEVFDKMLEALARDIGAISDDFFPSRLPFLLWVLAAFTLVGSFYGKSAVSPSLVWCYIAAMILVLIWFFIVAFRTKRFFEAVVPFLVDLIEEVKASGASGNVVVPSVADLLLRMENHAYFQGRSCLVAACSLRVCLLSYRP